MLETVIFYAVELSVTGIVLAILILATQATPCPYFKLVLILLVCGGVLLGIFHPRATTPDKVMLACFGIAYVIGGSRKLDEDGEH